MLLQYGSSEYDGYESPSFDCTKQTGESLNRDGSEAIRHSFGSFRSSNNSSDMTGEPVPSLTHDHIIPATTAT